jgi:hypothetical protein
VLDRIFGKAKENRDINRLIHDIADHQRTADYRELLARLPKLTLYFPVSQAAAGNLPRGERIQVPSGSNIPLPAVTIDGRTHVLLYASKSDNRLDPGVAEIDGTEALRMVLRIPNSGGLVIQAEGTAWVGIERDKVAYVLQSVA